LDHEGVCVDPLLESYTKCDEAATAEQLLQDLVGSARPTIENVVGRRLAFSTSAEQQDRDDVCGEVVLELLRRLRGLRDGENTVPIESFSGYVASAAGHACDAYLRRKYPQRRQLKNKLRYILSTEPQFAIWETAGSQSEDWPCGFKAWKVQGKERTKPPAEGWRTLGATAGTGRSRRDIVALLKSIFDSVQGPISLEELVGIVARLWGINDRMVPIDPEASGRSLIADPESHLVQRRGLESLWNEICELAVPQRAALLLNLRSGEGDSPIVFLPLMGIASIRQIASVLSIPAEEFADLWGRLPLDDQTIAGRLGITRQQVINLRKSARERLRRRVEGHGAD
jgi:RNA polymerase sigma factor (sigma-70 family)